MRYRLLLARPEWVAGTALAATGLAVLLALTGGADDVRGGIVCLRFVVAVLAGGAAAALLDSAAAVLDATPYPRLRRRLAPPLLAFFALATVGLAICITQAARVPGIPWPALALQSMGLLAAGGAAGACLHRRLDPGLVAPFAGVALLVADARMPWGPALTAPPGPDWARSQIAWGLLAVGLLVITAIALRDPAGRRTRSAGMGNPTTGAAVGERIGP